MWYNYINKNVKGGLRCNENNKTLLDYVLEHEEEDILDYIDKIRIAMRLRSLVV